MSDSPDAELIREAEAEVEEVLHGPERKLAALEERASRPQPVETAPVVAEASPPAAAPEPIPPPVVEPPKAPEQPTVVESRSLMERLLDEYATKPLCPTCGQPPPYHYAIEELEAFVRAADYEKSPSPDSSEVPVPVLDESLRVPVPPTAVNSFRIHAELTEAADILQRAFPVGSESPRPPLKPPQAHAVLVKLMEKHADQPEVVEALTAAAKILSVNLYPGFEPVSVRVESYLIAPDAEGDARARYHAPFRPSWLESYDLTKWRVEAWYVENQRQPLGFLYLGGCTKTCHAGADVVLRVKNLSKDTACFTGELVGYARQLGR
jgi:hypothetical protein